MITPRTRAVIAVHFWGYPADVAALRELCDARGLALIEDAAQAFGARVPGTGAQAGTVGDAGCLSFFSKKQLPVGEGGDGAERPRGRRGVGPAAPLARDDRRARGTATAATSTSYDVVDIGFNFRLDEPRAALGLSRLARLTGDLERRREAARPTAAGLAGTPGITLPFSDEDVERSSHFAFAVLFDDAETRIQRARRAGRGGHPDDPLPGAAPLTEFAGTAEYGSLPAAEAVAARHLALPLHAHLDEATIEQVVGAVRAAAQAGGISRSRIDSNSRIASS